MVHFDPGSVTDQIAAIDFAPAVATLAVGSLAALAAARSMLAEASLVVVTENLLLFWVSSGVFQGCLGDH